jgi:hypothetical protein
MPPDEPRRLSPQQQAALKQLLMGASITKAAQAAGVTRQTVSEWSNHHHAFQAELTRRRAEALRDVQQRLEEAALMAVEVLAQIAADPAVAAGDRIKASGAILERCGLKD